MVGVTHTAMADFTLSGRSTVMTMGMNQTGREALMIKDHQMRRDLNERGRNYSYLYDIKRKEVAVIDHLMRTAEVRALTARSRSSDGNNSMSFNIKPTGRNTALGDWHCEEFELAASMPIEWGTEKATIHLEGQVWLDRKASERKELAPFIQTIENEDFFAGTASNNSPTSPQVRIFNEAARKMLSKGMVCATQISFKFEGAGPMADLARRSQTRAGMAYEAHSDAAISEATFAIPAGYRVDRR
ncbi:MAG: hypothetical protein D4R70_02420 [Betaproteobacteria bacterium]|nr:MAG: hypothetical protein D4R70_02420 [Betaproteobacteria bacterium]